MKKLFIKIIPILFLTTILSVFFHIGYLRQFKLTYQWPKNIWILPEIHDKYKLVVLGNSHAQDGIVFYRYNIRAISLANVSQSFEYDLAQLKMRQKQIASGAVILINISPLSFGQAKPTRNDSLQTVYYSGNLSPFLIPHLKVEDYLQSQIVPFYRTGHLWRQEYQYNLTKQLTQQEKSDFVKRSTSSATPSTPIMPTPTIPNVAQEETNSPNMAYLPITSVSERYFYSVSAILNELNNPTTQKPDLLKESVNFMYNKWYNTQPLQKEYFESNRNDLEKLIKYCKTKGWKPVILSIPISDALKKGLLPDFMETYLYSTLKKTDLQEAPFFDFNGDTRLTKNAYLFSNSDHFNPKGAVIFSYLLLQKLIDQGYLPKSVDGYVYETVK